MSAGHKNLVCTEQMRTNCTFTPSSCVIDWSIPYLTDGSITDCYNEFLLDTSLLAMDVRDGRCYFYACEGTLSFGNGYVVQRSCETGKTRASFLIYL